MKKTKLLIATPIILAPVAATLPLITSCNKNNNISLSGEFGANVKVEAVTKEFVVGEPYVLTLTIKDEKIGKEYLPNSLTSVKTGGKELHRDISNDDYDYYNYATLNNNTKAYLFISNVSGNISIDAKTSKLASLSVTPIDITGTSDVEYEVGETANDANRVYVQGILENDDTFSITDGYTINLTGFESDYEFKTSDIDKTGTGKIVFNGVTSKDFKYKVIAETQAFLYYSDIDGENFNIQKCTSIADGIDKYNKSSKTGIYHIAIVPGTYNIAESIEVQQKKDTSLVIRPWYVSEEEVPRGTYWVKLVGDVDGTSKSVFNVTSTAAATGSSITFWGLKFNNPTAQETTTDQAFADIVLDSNVHDIEINRCGFSGYIYNTNNVFGVVTKNSGVKYLSMIRCEGEYLDSMFTGTILHDAGSEPDFIINDSRLEYGKHLFDVTGDGVEANISEVAAWIMWDSTQPTPTNKADVDGGMNIKGTGKYVFDSCLLYQDGDATYPCGFVQMYNLAGATSTTREIIFNTCALVRQEDNLHDVYNFTNIQDEDWTISWTNSSSEKESGTACGKEADPNHVYWDHTI